MTEDDHRFVDALNAWMRKQLGWGDRKEVPWKDDWTLIIALHAMIETGLNAALLRELERPALAGVVAKLDTSNGNTGKVAFAKALGILDKSSVLFLQQLSELRNKCVHDVRNFGFNLIEYLTEIGTEKRAAVLKHIYRMAATEPSCPQEGLLIGTMSILSGLMVHDKQCQARDSELKLTRLEAELYRARKESIPKE